MIEHRTGRTLEESTVRDYNENAKHRATHTYVCTEGHYHDGNRKDGSSCPDRKGRPTPRPIGERLAPITPAKENQ